MARLEFWGTKLDNTDVSKIQKSGWGWSGFSVKRNFAAIFNEVIIQKVYIYQNKFTESYKDSFCNDI